MISSYLRNIFLLLLVLAGSLNVAAQTRLITGTVSSATDEQTIPGVTVVVPGTTIGTITNLDGVYSIEVPVTADSLEFRFVGMATQRVFISGHDTIDVRMTSELYTVDEVVVTALGISREAKSLGYSVTAVNSDAISEGNNRSVLNALQGKVAGVNISSASGAPGASTRILMRGVTSLTGSNQPLFIIDGIPVSNAQSGSTSINGGTDFGNKINDVNPEDIESVSILKGAAGTALYGSRAANGVIIITTKSGRKNTKSKISFNSSVSFEAPLRLVQYQNEYGQGINGNAVLYENMSWGPVFDSRFRPWGHVVDSTLRVKAYRALPDNVKEFFEAGKSINNSISISGGSESSTYYLSYSNIQWDGIFPTNADTYTKHTVLLKASQQVTKRFETSFSINYKKKNNSYVPTGQGEQSVYNMVMQTPRDISLRELADLGIDYNSIDNHYSLYTVNPYQVLEHNGNKNTGDYINGSLDFDYSLTNTMALKWRIGADISNEQRKSWRSRIEPIGNNQYSAVFDPGSVGEGSSYSEHLNSDIIFTYSKKFENWEMSFLAGQSVNQRKARGLSASVQYLTVDGFFNLQNSDEPPNAGEATSMVRLLGVMGDIDISYRNLLFASVSVRNEWSSTLPLQYNSYFFPGVNTGFIFTELFPSIKQVLTYGKLRASWARVGNGADPYQVYSVFTQGFHSDGYGYFSYPLAVGSSQVNAYDVSDVMANDQLKPELTDEYEVGTDLRFFNNRFSIDFSYYNKSTTNLIWPVPVPYSSGYSRQMQNLGKISNYGFESLITIAPIRKNNFGWEVSLNFTKNYNKLNYLNSQLESAELNALRVDGGMQIVWLAIPGQPIGVFQARGPKYTSDGKMVVDNQGLPVADDELVSYGNSQNKYFGSITNNFTYKNISLSFQIDVRQGGLMYSRTKNISLWAGTVPETLYNNREPFIVPNSVVEIGEDENGDPVYVENTKPIDATNLVSFWGNGGLQIDGASLIDRSFVKLREVVITYNFPKKLLEKTPLGELGISIIGHNLLLFTPADQTYIDPEMTTFGNDLLADFGEYGAQPTTRSIIFNLRVTF